MDISEVAKGLGMFLLAFVVVGGFIFICSTQNAENRAYRAKCDNLGGIVVFSGANSRDICIKAERLD